MRCDGRRAVHFLWAETYDVEWLTTSTILRGLRDYQNDAAWGWFVERFREPLVRFARGAGLPDADAEDVAQETLVAFADTLRAGRYDRQKGRLRQWLFGIAYRQIARQRERRGGREVLLGGGGDSTSFWAALPDEQASAAAWEVEWEQCLWQACAQRMRAEFAPDDVRIFELIVRDGIRPADAAERAGCTVKAVYNAKYRILKRMRELREQFENVA